MNAKLSPSENEAAKMPLFYVIGYFLSRSQVFVLLAFLTRTLTKEDYGAYETLTSFGVLITALFLFNQETVLSTVVQSVKSERKNSAAKSSIVTSLLSGAIITLLVGLFCLLGLLWDGDRSLFFQSLFLATLLAMATGFNELNNLVIRNQFESKRASTILVGKAMIGLIFGVVTIAFIPGLRAFFISQILAQGLIAVFYVILNRDVFYANFEKELLKRCFKLALPLLPFSLVAWALLYSDRWVTMWLLGLDEVAVYGLATRVAAITGIVLGPFQLMWMPFAQNKLQAGQAERLFPQVARFMMFLGVLVVTGLTLFSPLILRILAPAGLKEAQFLIPFLVFCNFIYLFFYFSLAIFLKHARTLFGSLTFSFGALLNVGINVLFLPKFGLRTLLIANFVGYSVMILTSFALAHRYQPIKYQWGRLLSVALGLALLTWYWPDLFHLHPTMAVGAAGLFVAFSFLSLNVLSFFDFLSSEKKWVRRVSRRAFFLHNSVAPWVQNDINILSEKFHVKPVLMDASTNFKVWNWLGDLIFCRFVFCWFGSLYFLPIVAIAKMLGKKVIVVCGGHDVARMPDIGYGAFQHGAIYRWARLALFHMADACFAVSESNYRECQENAHIPKEKLHRVYLGFENFHTGPLKPFHERKNQIVTIGGINTETWLRKGFKEFFEVAEKMPQYEFVLVGRISDQLLIELSAKKPSNLRITGFLNNMEFIETLSESKVYLQLSRHEGFGASVVDSAICGVFPIVFDRFALAEVVGENGIVVPWGNIDQVISAIEATLQSSVDVDNLAQSYLRRFPLSLRRERILQIIDQLVKE